MWSTASSDFLKHPMERASITEVANLFDSYERVLVEFNMHPNAIATKHHKTFTAYSPRDASLICLANLEYEDEVIEKAWLANGRTCWVKTEGDIEVGTGLPAQLIEYGEHYGRSGPYESPHSLVWDVFKGLVDCEEVVLLLDEKDRWRVQLSPMMPLIYAGFDAVCDQYDLDTLRSADLLALGWSNLLMLVPEAAGTNLTDYLLQASKGTADTITKTLIKKAAEDILAPYNGDYDESLWAEHGI